MIQRKTVRHEFSLRCHYNRKSSTFGRGCQSKFLTTTHTEAPQQGRLQWALILEVVEYLAQTYGFGISEGVQGEITPDLCDGLPLAEKMGIEMDW